MNFLLIHLRFSVSRMKMPHPGGRHLNIMKWAPGFRFWSLRCAVLLGFGIWNLQFLHPVAAAPSAASAPARDYPVKPVPFTSVHLRDIFWAPRIETNRLV